VFQLSKQCHLRIIKWVTFHLRYLLSDPMNLFHEQGHWQKLKLGIGYPPV
jgi:hypothetical protein